MSVGEGISWIEMGELEEEGDIFVQLIGYGSTEEQTEIVPFASAKGA